MTKSERFAPPRPMPSPDKLRAAAAARILLRIAASRWLHKGHSHGQHHRDDCGYLGDRLQRTAVAAVRAQVKPKSINSKIIWSSQALRNFYVGFLGGYWIRMY